VLPTDKKITIATNGAGYDFEIDWGDGTTGKYMGSTPSVTHTYATFSSGDSVQIKITGAFPKLYCNNSTNCQQLRSVDQWGDNSWLTFNVAFYGANDLTIAASDTPNMTNVVDMSHMFRGVVQLTGNFSGWNTSKVTNMTYLFNGATNFNQDLSSWDVSKVNNFQYMFQNATSFDQDLSMWKPIGVTAVANYRNMLDSTALSVYNYNELLDKRSQLPLKDTASNVIFGANTKYGGCEANAQAGINGHVKLTQLVADGGKAWAITDGGVLKCELPTKYPSCDTPDIIV
jgi:surface protein